MTQTKVPEISIVVAVYKAEAYIRRCLDSILAQTFTDYEVIMVDDGSPDRSGEICEEYARRDPRFKVVHKENGGVGSARKVGMEHSRGRYSSHIDPDDWVEPTFLELLHKAAEENNADMAICNVVKEYGDRKEICYPMESRKDALPLLKDGIYAIFDAFYGSFLLNKLIRMDIYKDNDIVFASELRLSEDTEVYFRIVNHSEKICYISNILYHYDKYSNKFSITENYGWNSWFVMDRFRFIKRISGSLSEREFNKIIGLTAHEIFYYDQNYTFSNKEFRNTFSPYLNGILKSDIEIWKKYNILMTMIGLKRVYRPFYMALKKLLKGKI